MTQRPTADGSQGPGRVDYQAVFSALPAPKLVVDPEGTILDVNSAFRALVQRTDLELVGHAISDFIAGTALQEVAGALRAVARTRLAQTVGPLRVGSELPDTGWRSRWWHLTVTPTTDASGVTRALVVRATDVTSVVGQNASRPPPDRDDAPEGHLGSLIDWWAAEHAAARVLQDSVMTALPHQDDLRLDVRYRPAEVHVRIGGDWYDGFVQPCGATMLVVGDVAGHDVAAAAEMTHIRSTLRTLGFAEDTSPAATLARTEQTLSGLRMGVLATAVVARVLPGGPGQPRHVTWSSAGHLPPIMVSADGEVDLVESEQDLVLGLDVRTRRSDCHRLLYPGETLVLYTDGLVERRDRALQSGLGDLVEAVARSRRRDGTLDLDAVLGAMCIATTEDDVTVLSAHYPVRGADEPDRRLLS